MMDLPSNGSDAAGGAAAARPGGVAVELPLFRRALQAVQRSQRLASRVVALLPRQVRTKARAQNGRVGGGAVRKRGQRRGGARGLSRGPRSRGSGGPPPTSPAAAAAAARRRRRCMPPTPLHQPHQPLLQARVAPRAPPPQPLLQLTYEELLLDHASAIRRVLAFIPRRNLFAGDHKLHPSAAIRARNQNRSSTT